MKLEVKARIMKRRYQLSSLDESDVKIGKDFDFYFDKLFYGKSKFY